MPLVRDAFARTARLVASARLRKAVLEPLADDENALADLAEIEGATSTRLIAQTRGWQSIASSELVHDVPHAHFINASFVYTRPRAANRYNPTIRGAWYAALKVETSIREVGYHLTRELSNIGEYNTHVDYGEMHASVAGLFADLRLQPDHASLNRDTEIGYPEGNTLAEQVYRAGHNGIIYPSVRHKGGTCIAALRPKAVQSVVQGDIYRLSWTGSPEFQWAKIG
ncbi:MAG: RES family NAD+ phosphorylase [Pseudomonadota bacterium]